VRLRSLGPPAAITNGGAELDERQDVACAVSSAAAASLNRARAARVWYTGSSGPCTEQTARFDVDLEQARADAAEVDHPVALCAERLAARAQGLLEGVDITAAEAWHDANALLAAVATLVGERAEGVIDQCAQLAYARLFPIARR
jgi:hypothetical protein